LVGFSRRQVRRPAGPAADPVRADDQSQHRKALGLTTSQTVLLRADEVIE
jgi:hypothetical protein